MNSIKHTDNYLKDFIILSRVKFNAYRINNCFLFDKAE